MQFVKKLHVIYWTITTLGGYNFSQFNKSYISLKYNYSVFYITLPAYKFVIVSKYMLS